MKREVRLEGLCCANCAAKIEQRTSKLEGVVGAVVDLMAEKLTLTLADDSRFASLLEEVREITADVEPDVRVSVAGYGADSPADIDGDAQDRDDEGESPLRKILMGVGAVLFLLGMLPGLSGRLPEPWGELFIFGAAYLLIGGEVVLRAAKNISKGQVFDENFLMTVATIGAFAIGEYPEGAAVMLFYQIGEAFQDYAVGKSRRSITALMDIRPDFANLKSADGVLRVSPEEVRVGDLIIVKPGEKIPLDGRVTDGYSALDTSALTGESLPRDVQPGSDVLSGSICTNGLLTIEVTRPFGESTVSKILALVQNASGNKAPVENFITKFARYYTPAVVFAAIALAIIPPLATGGSWSEWINRALVFLVVSCPCALVISIPLSFFGGIGGASRNGILVKGSSYLDALHNVDTIVFDKTGTLTRGVFSVTEIVPANGFSADSLLKLAAGAESGSNHPIAQSIVRAYINDGKNSEAPPTTDSYEEIAGHGIRAEIGGKTVLAGNAGLMNGIAFDVPDVTGTVVYLAVDGVFAGHIVIADEVKPDSKSAIAALKALGVRKTAMLTGDARAVGEEIGRELGLDEIHSELLPQDKVDRIERLFEEKPPKGKLLFVGDGINDAPVLARADVGIAMGGVGSDAAIEAADVVLMTDEPGKLVTAIKVAKSTRAIVMQNIVFALAVKGVILALGAAGIATMWIAVFGDVGVALIAVLNAMRAMKKNPS
ncbi:MAG: cadmium-translocating P-type ATPase [Oscillospiraceae bacterium]|nr:cadmium-translocating P-type ATPase [Oscillospiraceae bacterium]